ncbi:MAG: hypothetical protein IJE62_06795 [Clostridia bacterium]|nr:hypothetical protein [Clostridia bacterium]
MNIKTELIKSYIAEVVCSNISDFEIDESKVADTTAVKVLGEIQQVLKDNKLDDFEMIEEIVLIFEKYNLNAGSCHEFG